MFLTRVLTTSVALLRGVLPDPLRDVLPPPRQIKPCPAGLRIDLHGIGAHGTERAARRLERRLCALPYVERAEGNGRIGCVFVGCDRTKADEDELLAIVAELDDQEERAPHAPTRLSEEHLRTMIRLAAGVGGIGLVVAGRVARLPRLTLVVP